MNHHVQHRARGAGGAVAAVSRSLTVTDLCLCLVPIGLFLSIVSLV
jgi:hypothetical protein